MSSRPAPKLNKIVASPPARLKATDSKRVSAAIRLGAGMQELIARCRLRPDGPPDTVADAPGGARFLPDFSGGRKPEDALRATFERLLKLERAVLAASDPTDAPVDPDHNGAAHPAPHPPYHDHVGGPWAEPAGTPTVEVDAEALASPCGEVEEGIRALIRAYAGQEEPGVPFRGLSGEGGMDALIGEWDAFIVERLAVAFPRTLAGYKVGKALGRTRWSIWEARRGAWENEDDPSKAWDAAFGARRIGELQRQINALNDVLDPTALTVVATGLGYWRNALLKLPEMVAPPAVRRRARTDARADARGKTIEVPAGKAAELERALERQLENWLDLLTGRRPPESFPVAGIVSALTRDLVATGLARLSRYVLPVLLVLTLLAILVILVLGAVLFFESALNEGEGAATVGGEVGGLAATGLAGIIASLLVRGRALLGRGAGAVDGLRERLDAWDARLGVLLGGEGKASEWATTALGLRRPSPQGVKEDVLSQLVVQIRLEELNVAVSEPLVSFVLALNDEESDDPMEDARRFLELTYGARSNLDRLLPAFKDLYKHLRAAPPG